MLKITQVLEAKVKAKIQKTGKTYHHSRNYAKHIIKGAVNQPKEHEFFLREDHGWKKVTEDEFKEATNKENVEKLHRKLEQELKERIKREMGKEEASK